MPKTIPLIDFLTQRFLVRLSHLNTMEYQTTFGGQIAAWIDETAYILASLAFPQATFVTRKKEIDFLNGAPAGTILEIQGEIAEIGRTSCTLTLTGKNAKSQEIVFQSRVVMVNSKDKKSAPISPEDTEEIPAPRITEAPSPTFPQSPAAKQAEAMRGHV
jgi:acyl-CoA hydrolase